MFATLYGEECEHEQAVKPGTWNPKELVLTGAKTCKSLVLTGTCCSERRRLCRVRFAVSALPVLVTECLFVRVSDVSSEHFLVVLQSWRL